MFMTQNQRDRLAADMLQVLANMQAANPNTTTTIPLGESDERYERALVRLKNCGRPVSFTDAKGNLREYTSHCGDYRRCPYCLKARADAYRDRIDHAFIQSKGNLVVTYMTESEAQSLTRGIDKSLYLRQPQDDGRVLIIARGDHERFSGIQSTMTIDDVDWLLIARTPEGKRPSGALGKKAATATEATDDKPEETVECKVAHITWDFDGVNDLKAAKEAAWKEALLETGRLNPIFDGDKLTHARNKRTFAYVREMKARGARVLAETWKNETVKLSAYSVWKKYELTIMEQAEKVAKRAGMTMTESGMALLAAVIYNERCATPAY